MHRLLNQGSLKGDFHVGRCEIVGAKFPCVTRLCANIT